MTADDRPLPCGQCQVIWSRVLDPDTGDAFAIVREPAAKLFITHPFPADLDAYYTGQYHGNRHGFTAALCDRRRERMIRRALARHRSQPQGGRTAPRAAASQELRWLDIGCGEGTLLARLAERGWLVRGVERFPESARSRGLIVFQSLDEAAEHGPYDGASLWHVLEHFTEPGAELERIRRVLKPSGVLLIAVPDAASWAARWFGPHWLHWDVPRHLFHFTPQSLAQLLSAHGFHARHLAASEFEYDLMGVAQSAMNRLGFQQNSFFKILTSRAIPLSLPAKLCHLAIGFGLCLAAALPVWLLGRFGRAGTLIFEARPAATPVSSRKGV